MTVDPGPIFIAGLDQSGKTPLRRILDASSDIAFWRRSYFWTVMDGRFGDLSIDENLERCLRHLEGSSALHGAIDVKRIGDEMRRGQRTYARLMALIGNAMAHKVGKARWGEQEGGVEERAERVFDAFPAARVLHMVRDPRDRYLATARRGRPGQLGISLLRSRRNMRCALANAQRYDGRYLIVRYEDLMESPEDTCLRVGGFIGEPTKGRLAAAAAAVTQQRGRNSIGPIIGQFRRDMPLRQIRLTERWMGPELYAMGYPLLKPRVPAIERLRYSMVDVPLNSTSAAAAALADRAGLPRATKLRPAEKRT
jgi:hypothetical protein